LATTTTVSRGTPEGERIMKSAGPEVGTGEGIARIVPLWRTLKSL
jgi:hypothetical protein